MSNQTRVVKIVCSGVIFCNICEDDCEQECDEENGDGVKCKEEEG